MRWTSLVAGGFMALATSCGVAGSDQPSQAALRLEFVECGTSNETRALAVAVAGGPGQLAVSVAHAFEGKESFVVQEADGSTMNGELVFLDTERDIAVIRLERSASETLPVTLANDENTEITFITYGDNDGPERKPAAIIRFVRLSLDGIGERDGIELAADVNSGDSGGPVVDADGRMIGMVFATSRVGESGWAVAANEIESAIDQVGDPIELTCS